MKDEENKEKGKGEMLYMMRSGKERLLFFCSCPYSSFILSSTPPPHSPERAGFPVDF